MLTSVLLTPLYVTSCLTSDSELLPGLLLFHLTEEENQGKFGCWVENPDCSSCLCQTRFPWALHRDGGKAAGVCGSEVWHVGLSCTRKL